MCSAKLGTPMRRLSGIESFFTTSEGEQEPNPAYLKAQLPALRRAGRAVSRKQKGGQNRRKAVGVLRAWHVRVKNLRQEHRHQVALKLCRRYGLIAVESLNTTAARLSRKVWDNANTSAPAVWRCIAKSMRQGTSLPWPGLGQNMLVGSRFHDYSSRINGILIERR